MVGNTIIHLLPNGIDGLEVKFLPIICKHDLRLAVLPSLAYKDLWGREHLPPLPSKSSNFCCSSLSFEFRFCLHLNTRITTNHTLIPLVRNDTLIPTICCVRDREKQSQRNEKSMRKIKKEAHWYHLLGMILWFPQCVVWETEKNNHRGMRKVWEKWKRGTRFMWKTLLREGKNYMANSE